MKETGEGREEEAERRGEERREKIQLHAEVYR